MVCPKCHFALSPFDVDCPRCRNFATLGIALPVPAQNAENDLGNVSAVDNLSQAAAQDIVGKSWYSQLDLKDKELEDKELEEKEFEDQEAAAESRSVEKKTAITPPLASKPLRPAPKQTITPAPVFRPRVPRGSMACQEDMQDAPTIQMHRDETSNLVKSSSFLFGGIAALAVLSLVVLLSLLIFGTGTAAHKSSTTANPTLSADPMLSRASDLISQANATQIQFQQSDLTPEIAANSLHSRTLQYQEALRLCRGSQASGRGQSSLILQQLATSGLKQVESDSSAQAARLLTGEVAKNIALYKGASLSDEKAASIRMGLRAECQSALVDCAQSLDIDPKNCVALAERVHAFRHLGDEQSANSTLAHALMLCPDNPILLKEKGI